MGCKNFEFFFLFAKCDPDDSCPLCINNGINAPVDVFRKLKSNGLPLPIKHPSRDEYLSYEESKVHKDRQVELLPSRNFKVKVNPKFKLTKSRARTTIICTDCNKPRVVFKVKKTSKVDLKKVEDEMDVLIWTCGAEIPFEQYEVNRNLHCKDILESMLYTELIDKFGADVLCHACGDLIPEDCLEEYLKRKRKFNQVKPCCHIDRCKKNKKIKWDQAYPSGSTLEFEHEQKFRRKMKTLKRKRKSNSKADKNDKRKKRRKRRKRQDRFNIFQQK